MILTLPDFHQWVGMTGIPVIESVVQYLREQWKLPDKLAPLFALGIGAIFNVALAWYLKTDLVTGFYVGLFAGFMSSFWHEIRTANNA